MRKLKYIIWPAIILLFCLGSYWAVIPPGTTPKEAIPVDTTLQDHSEIPDTFSTGMDPAIVRAYDSTVKAGRDSL